MLKVVILIGGPMKGTRFRPLSLELPKPLFPIAGFPIVHHHIEACKGIPDLKEIVLIGFYQVNDSLTKFISAAEQEFGIPIRYLQEFQALGTAGGLYHFRDQISMGNPDLFIVINADIMFKIPLKDFIEFHKQHPGKHTIVATEDYSMTETVLFTSPILLNELCNSKLQGHKKQVSLYGCLVEKEETNEVLHYVEKPETFVSDLINCGVYAFTPPDLFKYMGEINQRNYEQMSEYTLTGPVGTVRMGEDILPTLAASGTLFVYKTHGFWTGLKSAGSAIYANRNVLDFYKETHPERLAENGKGKATIVGDVYIHPSAVVDPTAVLGPNVSVGSKVVIGPGARVRESILLDGAELKNHCCILHSIVGWNCTIGAWSRVEGTSCDPNPNDKFARPNGESLFRPDGKLTPSITILGRNVSIPPEVIILNSIVLPHKDLSQSHKNEIIL